MSDAGVATVQAYRVRSKHALVTVRDGISPERAIHMSPIASDGAFVGTVHDAGMRIAIPNGMLEPDWLAGTLAHELGKGNPLRSICLPAPSTRPLHAPVWDD